MEQEITLDQAKKLLEFIENKWNDFTFDAKDSPKDSENPDTVLYLPEKYIAPNQEKFSAMFYWDSYFIIQGLKTENGQQELIKGIVDNCLYEIETYGKVLNANKKRWSTRSQMPYLSLMIKEVYEMTRDKNWLKKAFDLVKKEYNKYWMDESHLTSVGLSRFYDESGDKPIGEYKKTHTYKSRAEASWDMSPRFDDEDVHDLLPIDLNCNLYQYEKQFEEFSLELENKKESEVWGKRAKKRKKTINDLMWSEDYGLFFDYNYKTGSKKKIRSLAGYQAMFVGLANEKQAEALRENIKIFETGAGLAACAREHESIDYQWDWPTVWAPLQYICYRGMQKYGFKDEAEKIATNFIGIVYKNWRDTGKIWEKYNGETGDLTQISERYPIQSGFGWTNAVIEVFIREKYKL